MRLIKTSILVMLGLAFPIAQVLRREGRDNVAPGLLGSLGISSFGVTHIPFLIRMNDYAG